MRHQTIEVEDIADITKSIAHYQNLVNHFPQIAYPRNTEISDRLKDLLTEFKADTDYWKSSVVTYWNNIEIHVSYQTWGSTACGWGGMGGSAMTTAMNFIVYNLYLKHAFVYWSGELAYICPIDEIKEGYRVPSLRDVKNAVYKNSRK